MKIYLVRHAEAVPLSGSGDCARHLTARGRKRFRRNVEMLLEKGPAPRTILTSPFVRAVQTAELLARHAGYSGEVHACTAIADEVSADDLHAMLRRWGKRLFVVGHEPSLSLLVAQVTGTQAVPFPKGGIAALDVKPDGTGRLEWMIMDGKLKRP
ncbi:MAG TPA: histidine phosphatase family protein [Verrucomicrobiae bacterium]|nr:histidine phosphatase family protein [Verrucomicrobiae bacterium]